MLIVLALLAPARADEFAPPPVFTGGITGTISPAAGLQAVVAVESFEYKDYPGTVDAKTGQFTVPQLPPGDYDLLVKTVGHMDEGLRLETDPDTPMLTGDALLAIRNEIGKTFYATEDYFNLKKIVRLTGTAERARMFVMQTRTRPVVDGNGNPVLANVRRFDLVEMLKTNKVWQLAMSKYLYREYVPYGTRDERIELKYSPGLSGFIVGEEVKKVGTIDLAKLPPGPVKKYVSGDYSAK